MTNVNFTGILFELTHDMLSLFNLLWPMHIRKQTAAVELPDDPTTDFVFSGFLFQVEIS
jgi:hypothetical protein